MGELLCNRVRERYFDLLDWVDIRPDFDVTWCLILAIALGAIAYALPIGMIIMCALMAAGVAIFFLVGGTIACLFWVAMQALADALAFRRMT